MVSARGSIAPASMRTLRMPSSSRLPATTRGAWSFRCPRDRGHRRPPVPWHRNLPQETQFGITPHQRGAAPLTKHIGNGSSSHAAPISSISHAFIMTQATGASTVRASSREGQSNGYSEDRLIHAEGCWRSRRRVFDRPRADSAARSDSMAPGRLGARRTPRSSQQPRARPSAMCASGSATRLPPATWNTTRRGDFCSRRNMHSCSQTGKPGIRPAGLAAAVALSDNMPRWCQAFRT